MMQRNSLKEGSRQFLKAGMDRKQSLTVVLKVFLMTGVPP